MNFKSKASTKNKSGKREVIRDYFDDDDEDSSSSFTKSQSSLDIVDEIDPLDAFMTVEKENVNQEVKKQAEAPSSSAPLPEIVSGSIDWDFDEYEEGLGGDDDEVDDGMEYNSDGEPIGKRIGEKKVIEPLAPVDHSSITYPSFRKNIYQEDHEIIRMTETEVNAFRDEIEVSVMGTSTPKPIKSFKHAGFQPPLLKEIIRVGYESPTPIQSQALPVALIGRDLIGLAKTGSGKTLAYIWPMLEHIIIQPQMEEGDGPIGIILAPTRELAAQIFTEAKKFAKVFGIRVCAIFGGAGKWEMSKALKESPEIVIGTPGRLIEMIKMKATNLRRCTMLVLDEADRMFEMGFEYQMRSIANNIRPDRQTLMFSATMKKKIEGFARDMLKNPIRVVVGTIGQANPDIKQDVIVVREASQKWTWLCSRLDEFIAEGKVLIFAGTKNDTEELGVGLRRFFADRRLLSYLLMMSFVGIDILHGDKDQAERTTIMKRFKAGETTVLVATDVASRGLDIKNILVVINYDVAKNIETHVHRIGRTGRMGIEGVTPGTAYTLLTSTDGSFAVDLVRNLQLSGQFIPKDVLKLAESNPKWARVKSRGSGGGIGGRGGLGFGPGGGPKAMTSSMAASQFGGADDPALGYGGQHFRKLAEKRAAVGSGSEVNSSQSSAIATNVAANPYIEGQQNTLGRGKHLTTPSWANDTDLSGGVSISQKDSEPASQSVEEMAKKQRVSRFSKPTGNSYDINSSSTGTSSKQPLSGFVRAGQSDSTLHSVRQPSAYALQSSSKSGQGSLPSTGSTITPSSAGNLSLNKAAQAPEPVATPAPPQPADSQTTRKKSRWDT